MLNFKQLNLILCCVCLTSVFGSDLCAQLRQTGPFRRGRAVQSQPVQSQPVRGQVIQGQPVQGQIIYGQPIQRQTIQGQPIQGQFIQGQPIQGGIIQGQPIQGGIIQGQPVQGGIIQGQPTVIEQQPTKAADASLAKIAELDERIKALTDENLKLGSLKAENIELKKSFEKASSEWELQNKSAMNAADAVAAREKELAQFKLQYQDLAKKSESMVGQVEGLTQENANLKKRLANVGNTDNGMKGLQADLDSATNKLSKAGQQNKTLTNQNNSLSGKVKTLTAENSGLKQRLTKMGNSGDAMQSLNAELSTVTSKLSLVGKQNESLVGENDRLLGLIEVANKDYEQLGGRLTAISGENEKLRAQFETASIENTSLGDRISSLSSENRKYVSSVNSLKSDIRKTAKSNERLAESSSAPPINMNLERENSLLTQQVSDLQGELAQFNRELKSGSTAAISLPTPAAVIPDATGNFSILRWLIPFLVIGLGVGLYTHFREEYRETTEGRENV